MKYQKKPEVVMAVQFTGDNAEEIGTFVGKSNVLGHNTGSKRLAIATKKGAIALAENDWIVRGQSGNFEQIDDEKFAEQYEPVD